MKKVYPVALFILLLAANLLAACNRPATTSSGPTPTAAKGQVEPLVQPTATTAAPVETALPAAAAPKPSPVPTQPPAVATATAAPKTSPESTSAPTEQAPAEATATPEVSATGEPGAESLPMEITHTVQPGENLFRIGLLYGISWEELMAVNDLTDPDAVYAGQVLVIPVEGPVETPSASATHVVQPGENLFRIALKYGMTWETLARANEITDPDSITAGMVLIIPALPSE